MAITTTFTLTSLGNLNNDFQDNVAITPVSGSFLTAGDNPSSLFIPFPPPGSTIVIPDIDLRPYAATGSSGAFSEGSSGGSDPSLVQLSSTFLSLTPNDVIMAFDGSDEVQIARLNADGSQDTAPFGIGDTNTSNADVAVLRAEFGFGGFSGGYVVAYQDFFSGTNEHDIELKFYNNSGALQNTRIVDGTTDNDDQGASVTQLDNGNVAVAWTRFNGGTPQVMCAVYSRDGNTLIQAPTVFGTAAASNRDVAIVATDTGFAVLYEESSGSLGTASRAIRMASFDDTGGLIASRVLVSSSGFGASIFDDIDVTRMGDGLLAFSYSVRSGLSIIGNPIDNNVVVRVTSQAPGDTTVSGPVQITGGAPGNHNAVNGAIAASGNQVGVIYANDTSGGSNGEILQLLRIQTGDDADDTFLSRPGSDSYVGAGGSDTVDYSAETAALVINLATGAASGGGATGDSFSSIENLIGGSANDSLTGDGTGNHLEGRVGDDTLAGGGGGDLIEGGAGHDRLLGAGGSDTMLGGGGHDGLNGGAGQDDLFGGAGIDTLAGGGGRDDLFGGGGRDSMNGGGGDDGLRGGGGADVLLGGGGRDTLGGGGGHDLLSGGGAADALAGGGGRDTLDGGAGNDILTGNSGSDVFVFGPGDGRDTITDFRNGQDRIDLTGGLTFADVNVISLGAGAGVRLTFDGEPGLTLTLLTATPGQIDLTDFI